MGIDMFVGSLGPRERKSRTGCEGIMESGMRGNAGLAEGKER